MSITPNNIIDRLDSFIRKYYKNLMIKGLLYSCAIIALLFITIVTVEHFGWFSSAVRTVFYWAFIVSVAVVLFAYVAVPLAKMHKLGKRISYETAASIIGKHFPEVDDKLTNLLQLRQMSNDDGSDLLLASIEQKTKNLSPIPFLQAVDLRGNVRYVKFVAIPLVVIAVSLIVAPSFITEPSKRIINHGTQYQKPAPFTFVLDNDSLVASQQDDFTILVHIDGNEIPDGVTLFVDDKPQAMKASDRTHYSHTLKNLQRTHHFRFDAAGVVSQNYTLTVLPRPTVLDFQLVVDYPKYIGKARDVFANEGDVVIPRGSRLEWRFLLKDADSMFFRTLQQEHCDSIVRSVDKGRVSLARNVMNSFDYSFGVKNSNASSDTISYSVTAVADAAPSIAVVQMTDSTNTDRLFFRGQIKDDYGISRLDFVIIRTNIEDTSIHSAIVSTLPVSNDVSQSFFHNVYMSEIAPSTGDRVQYYFEVWDNDGIDGPKSSKSKTFEVQIPTESELSQIIEKRSDDIHSTAAAAIDELRNLQQEIDDLLRKLVDKKEITWQDKKEIEQLKKRQDEIKANLSKMQDQIKENNRLEEKYREQGEQILEKQKELDRLFDQVMSDDMKKLMEEMDRLMQQMDKNKVQEELEKIKLKNEDVEKQIDQNIELLKRLELEKRVEQAVKQIDELAEKQEKLSEQKGDAHNDSSKQQKLNDEFQELKKDLENIQKDYKKLDNSTDFNIDKELGKQIEKNQEGAMQDLQRGKRKDASRQQKQAADDMRKLSQQVEKAQQDIEQSELAEDSETVRRLLKNLVQLSFNQEDLIGQLFAINIQDPKYQTIILQQNTLKDDFGNVEDSLHNMAKRQIAIAALINKEVSDVKRNVTKSLGELLEFNQTFYGNSRNTTASRSMQYSMTALNNLALVMAESLDKMQNQMRQNQQKSGQQTKGMKIKTSCSNPGSGKPSPKSMKQMQDELNKQIQHLKEQLDKQGAKTSKRPKLGEKNSMSSEFARMAAQQEQIRRMMQQYGQEIKQQNAGNSKLAREINELIKQMEQTETDLVNKTITSQTIRRQKQIMTRLLQHEKAEMEREKDDRRESHEASDSFQPTQGDLEQFKKLQEKNVDLFHTTPPSLQDFYKKKVSDYFFRF